MSEYSEDYCLDHDVDYFSIINGQKSHIASNGSIIPSLIDNKINEHIQDDVYSQICKKRDSEQGMKHRGSSDIPKSNNVSIQVDSIKRILYNDGYEITEITDEVIRDYAASFVEFAELGFDSYDTISGRLVLIAEPERQQLKSNLEIEEIPFINNLQLQICEDKEVFKFGFSEGYLLPPNLQ